METSSPIPIGTTANHPARWQMVLEIARKDLVVIAKTPSILLMILLPVFMQLLFQVIFAGLGQEERLRVALYDPAGSRLAVMLEALPDIELQSVASQAELETALAGAEAGIAVSADFDSALAGGEQPELAIWLNPQPGRQAELANFRRYLVEELWRLNERQAPVRLSWILVNGAADPADDSDTANAFLLGLVLITGMAMCGFTVSLLIVEEKDERTFDALLLSPAGKAEFIAGKGLAVFLYTLLIAGIMLIISGQLNEAWLITTATVFLGALFMVGSGLLSGTIFNSRYQCNTGGGFLILILMIPAILAVSQPPPTWLALLRLIPTFYLTDALMMILNQAVVASRLGLDLAVLIGCVLLLYFFTWQRLKSQ